MIFLNILLLWTFDEPNNLTVKWNLHIEKRPVSSISCFFTFFGEHVMKTRIWRWNGTPIRRKGPYQVLLFFTFLRWICDESDNLAVKWNSHQEERAASSFYCFLPQGGASVLDICAVNQTWSFSYQIFLLYIKSFHSKNPIYSSTLPNHSFKTGCICEKQFYNKWKVSCFFCLAKMWWLYVTLLPIIWLYLDRFAFRL